MSGETEDSVSAWTIDSLHAHLVKLMDERDRRYEQRFTAQEKAVATANEANEKRLDSVNEFRQQQADIVANYMPRTETEQRISQNAEKIDTLSSVHATDVTLLQQTHSDDMARVNSRLDLMAGKSSGTNQFAGYLFAAAGAGAAVAAIVTAVLK